MMSMEELNWEKEEKRELLNRFRNLYKSCKKGSLPEELSFLKQAFRISANAHREKRRENGDPFIFHALAVAQIVIDEIGLKGTAAVAVLLHETFRIGKLTNEEISKEYNSEIATIVIGLNKISEIDPKTSSSEAENYRQLVISYSADPRVILIKLADRLDVMRHLFLFTEEKRQKKAKETLTLYAPLAHRLGLYSVKSELEDLSLKYSEPSDYTHIVTKLEETAKERNTYIAKFIKPIIAGLDQCGQKYEIKSRTKSVFSIWKKMKKQKISFEEVYDLFAIRIILESDLALEKAECWRTYSIVTEKYIPNTERMRDWISVPKSNGYESLHSTVIGPDGKWVEVQIRTRRMDEIAEMGIAAHWKYKGIKQQQGIDDWLTDLRNLMEQAEDPNDMVESLKQLDSYQKEIFVFTPNGDLKKIPAGTTVLDFAFEVHSKLGVSCVGAKVNNKLASIKDKLKNGDQVSIITAKNQKPTKDWLSFVITSKARSKIKQSLKEEDLKVANMGKELLSRRLKNWKMEFTDEMASQFIKKNKIKSITEFYAMLVNGKLEVSVIKEYIENSNQVEEKTVTQEAPHFQYSKEPESGDFLVIDEHLSNIDYKLATCCNPIFGDEIFGFVTINNGIKIHRNTCPNAKSMLERYSYRIVKAKWQQTRESNSFQTTIRIIGEDQIGFLTRISEVLSKEMKVNLRSATFDTKGGLFEGKIKVYVQNIKQLDMIIHRINRIKGVIKASRVATSE